MRQPLSIQLRLTVLALLLCPITACATNVGQTQDDGFVRLAIPLTEMNEEIRLRVPGDVNSFRISEMITLLVDNYSESQIQIVPDKDIRIFQKPAGGWVEIKNLMNYSSRIEIIPIKDSENPGGTIYQLAPEIVEKQTTVYLRIVVIGTKDPDGSASKIGAYVDLTMHP